MKQHSLASLDDNSTWHLKAEQQSLLLVSFKNTNELNYWHEKLGISPVILLTRSEQVYEVIFKIPEILWDIIEYAEKPLEVYLQHAKELPASAFTPDKEVVINLLRNGELFHLLKPLRKPVFAFPISAKSLEGIAWPSEDNVLPLATNEIYPTQPKRLRLGLNGDIKFL
ncbi:hypothetical protein QWY31_07115 [Cytophagales bacterium LB-30]|uniref:Uncharacterized protein n=1 Tax=Shiella aurantiaca TaxID=3058365 RepID=A0ABT8F4T8_9BACT|nr:hypothetical protein [Shiella aurantiaca]MDN4165264.1 hypothetical protein [Shiella aurantiaca]